MATLEFDGVSKIYDNKSWAVRDLNLTVKDGEFMVFVGPSGCGKTTALRMLAGFEEISAGEIRIGEKRVNEVPPRARDIAMVFQNYALYPHMNVYDNIGYGLKVRRVPKQERGVRIERAAETLGLTNELKRKPSELSGGQRQRVAMGRAIVREPQAFLMDEPLSNLDARLRVRMRTEIARLQRDLGVTTVYVTHDQVEAMTMADRVAVIRGGVLQQLDTPQFIYANPANLFVATFIGSPAMNVVEATLSNTNGTIECNFGSYSVTLPDQTLSEMPKLVGVIGQPIAVGIRPDAISLAADGSKGLKGTVAVSEELGSEVMSHIDVNAKPVRHSSVVDAMSDESEAGAGAHEDATTIVARLPADSNIRHGDKVTLTVDAKQLHFFSLEDGLSLRTTPAPSEPLSAVS